MSAPERPPPPVPPTTQIDENLIQNTPDVYLASPPDILLAASRDTTLINMLRDLAPQNLKKWIELIYYSATIRSGRTPGEEIVGLEMINGNTGAKIGVIVKCDHSTSP
jgi:hypothetical protein